MAWLTVRTLVLFSVTGAALAQDGAGEREDAREHAPLDTVTVVGTRTERALSEVAATVSVITREDLERQLTRDIADLVRFEPGVTVGGTGSRFGLGGFSIRGIGGNRVLTLVDGIRVPEEFSFGPFLSARRDFVDVDSLARAEIARGPISSLYGSDALGGVVVLTTRGPRDYLDGGQGWYGGLKAGYSSADESTVGTATLASGNERIAGMLAYTKRDAHETDTAGSVGGVGAGRELPDPQDIDSDNVLAKLSLSLNDEHEILFSVDRYDNRTDTRILSDYGEVANGTTTDRRDARDERTRTRVSLVWEYTGELIAAESIEATVYRQESESLQVTDEDQATAGGEVRTRRRTSRFLQDIDGAFVQFGKSLETASARHYLTWGADWYRTGNEGLRDGGSFAADGTPIPEFLPLPTRDFPLTEVTQTAVFVQDEITLLDDRLLLSPGLRYDRFDADAESDAIYEAGNLGQPPPEDYEDAEVTAKLGAVYALNDAWSVYGRYSEGFRAPPYDDVNVGFTNFIGGYKTISNPDLESERSQGVELGTRVAGNAGTASIAVFRNDYEDFIESFAIAPAFLSTGGIDPADGLLTFQSINREEVEISGAELTGTLDLGALASRLDRMSLRVAVAYADGEDKATGEPIDSIEPLTGVLGIRYTSADDRWGAELILTAVAAKDRTDIAAGSPRLPTHGYGIVDLLANYAFTERVRVNLGLFNLGDRSYIRWADTAGIGNDAPARFTQPGFNAGATLQIEL